MSVKVWMPAVKTARLRKMGFLAARCRLVWLLVFAFIAARQAGGAESDPALEYKVKAGYLINFAKYVEWPTTALSASNSPFFIGVIDSGEALPALQLVLDGRQVNGHPVKVIGLSPNNIAEKVQILFVTRSGGKAPDELWETLGSPATLLVGETDQFAERGGMVGFVREQEAIRVTLNLERVTQAGLKVSAKLASVARVVKSPRPK